MRVYDFGTQDEFAASYSTYYADLCELYFKDFVFYSDVERSANPAQLAGIDAFVLLSSGKVVTVDFKADKYDSPRFCIEILSDVERRKPGWLIKPGYLVDYIAYLFTARDECYFLPTEALRNAVKANYAAWKDLADRRLNGFRWIEAANKTYTTLSLGVPIEQIERLLGTNMCVS